MYEVVRFLEFLFGFGSALDSNLIVYPPLADLY